MSKGRLEAFSDGVIAIIITIMVLELKVPREGHDLTTLKPLLPVFISYAVSFVFVAIYWNNHHHTLHAVKSISGPVLWANMFFLFWLSIIPFATAWTGESEFKYAWPAALYGFVLLMSGFSYNILTKSLIKHEGENSVLAAAIGRNRKGRISIICYLVAIGWAFKNTHVSFALYIVVACLWFIPDTRIESILAGEQQKT